MRFAFVLVNGRPRVALAGASGVAPVSESTMLEIIHRVMGKEDVWEGPIAIENEGVGRLENPIDRVALAGNRVGLIEPNPANVWPPRYAA